MRRLKKARPTWDQRGLKKAWNEMEPVSSPVGRLRWPLHLFKVLRSKPGWADGLGIHHSVASPMRFHKDTTFYSERLCEHSSVSISFLHLAWTCLEWTVHGLALINVISCCFILFLQVCKAHGDTDQAHGAQEEWIYPGEQDALHAL